MRDKLNALVNSGHNKIDSSYEDMFKFSRYVIENKPKCVYSEWLDWIRENYHPKPDPYSKEVWCTYSGCISGSITLGDDIHTIVVVIKDNNDRFDNERAKLKFEINDEELFKHFGSLISHKFDRIVDATFKRIEQERIKREKQKISELALSGIKFNEISY